MHRTIVKIVFYILIVALAFAAALLYYRVFITTENKQLITNDAMPTDQQPVKNTCMITVDGKIYDVQPLRTTHAGGDIFKCDTDMSSIFHGQHGESVKRIEKYLIE